MNGALAVADTARRAARWLERENGRGVLQQFLQCVAKLEEEMEEVLDSLDTDCHGDAAGECADLIIAARVGQLSLGHHATPDVEWARPGAPADAQEWAKTLTKHVLGLGRCAIAWQGQNPRKAAIGEAQGVANMAAQLDAAASTAAFLIAALGYDVDDVLLEVCEKVNGRLDKAGVPR